MEPFAKGKQLKTSANNTCVIYTRVSTREQAENNMSLDTQRRACDIYAKKHSYKVMAYFGGTFESAKTDEREEFNHMLSFVQKTREKVSYIIVYSVDRFSRSGANAIYITEQLKHNGISVVSVTQPTDVSTPSGVYNKTSNLFLANMTINLEEKKQ
ncbi:MAG: recombinase family protein [Sphingobacteriaceae bacterium]|nr:recombinase family protein [Sphingobacteriaceae bacterium]